MLESLTVKTVLDDAKSGLTEVLISEFSPLEQKQYACVCGKQYKRATHLYRHQRFECGKGPQFACPQCNKRYMRKDKMKAHLARKHSHVSSDPAASLKAHVCTTCGHRYKRKAHLTRHQRYECNVEPQFACSYCPYRAKQKEKLTRHMGFKHFNFDRILPQF
ncbi:hypothetical protein J6590_014785 [Homalodisca vitripennis]|nr:hypothetical protein J6590_014785 [Homalodisca vitripennis]